MITIKLKHEKSLHKVEVDVEGGLEILRAQLYTLTGVPADRQKVIIKGKELKEGDDLSAILKNGTAALLMGSAEAIPEAPKERQVFIEDMAGDATIEIVPPGLRNLDNTCYLNATIQCYRMCPEFRKQLEALPTMPPAPTELGVMNALKGLYLDMDKQKGSQPVVPMLFVMMCRQFWPQFDQQEQGRYMQQDAEEYCTSVMQAADVALRGVEGSSGVGRLFEGEHAEVMRCIESDAEPVVPSTSTFRILRCNMDTDTATVETGLEKAMHGSREKNSEILGRNAEWEVSSKLNRLPEYLWVNLVRFEWRKNIGKKTKKLRKVVFPFKLDVFVLCSDDLKERMKQPREDIRNEMDRALEAKRRDKQEKLSGEKKEDKKEEEKKDAMDVDAPEAPKEDAVMSSQEGGAPEADSVGNNNGYYELCGIVTHKGRDADSGHYIGWTKQEDGRWMCFDDHKVYEVSEDKIKELAGGGEADSAYLLLYRTRDEKGKLAGLL